MPSPAAFLAMNLWGICTRMPAPSPARGSAPTAPRCSRLTRIVSASSTILCDLRPLMSAINPTPQESFSSAGSNRPKPDASIAHALLAVAPNHFASRPRRIHPALPFATVPPAGRKGRGLRLRATHFLGGNLRAGYRPLVACSCRRPTRPRPSAADPALLTLYFRSHIVEWNAERALRIANWDSNAVLCRTWQIPPANTSGNTEIVAKKAATRPIRHGFLRVPHFKWIMGCAFAQWYTCARAASQG